MLLQVALGPDRLFLLHDGCQLLARTTASLDSTEAQGLTAACKSQRKYCRRLGTSSCRRAFDTPSKCRQLPGNLHLIPPRHCSRSYNGDGVWRSTARRRSVGSTRGNPALVLHSLRCKNAEVRTRQALCNRIQLVECCRRTLGIALAPGTTRWKSI